MEEQCRISSLSVLGFDKKLCFIVYASCTYYGLMCRSEAYSFDSTALERAATAAKELEKSKFAKEALALSQQQEMTKQQEQMVKVKEYEASIEQMKIEGKRVEGEQRRKYLEEENKQAKLKSEYQVAKRLNIKFILYRGIYLCKRLRSWSNGSPYLFYRRVVSVFWGEQGTSAGVPGSRYPKKFAG